MAKRKLVQFYRNVPGKKRKELVRFYRTVGGRKRRRDEATAVIPTGRGNVKMRVRLSDCVNIDNRMRCTVTPLKRK